MSNKCLTTQDLLNLAQAIHQLISISATQRVELYRNNQITLDQSRSIFGFESRLSNLANELVNLAIKSIITDLEDAASVLNKTTENLKSVIQQLTDFNNFIGTLAKLVNLFSRITQAIAGGSTAIVRDAIAEIQSAVSSSSSRDVSAIDEINSIAGDINEF